MPEHYFEYAQSTLMRIEYPDVGGAQFYSASFAKYQNRTNIGIYNNTIQDNLNMQVVTFSDLQYKSSILDFDCEISSIMLTIEDNVIRRN